MEPNRPEQEPGPPTESVTQQAATAAKTVAKEAAKTAAKKAAKEGAKKAATSAASAIAAHPVVALIILAVVLLIAVIVLVGTVLTVGFLSGAVGDLYEEDADRPVCYRIPDGDELDGAFNVSAHTALTPGSYQGVVGVVDGYPTCVDPRLIYILSDIAEAGFPITKSGFGITTHHFWVGAYHGGDNRYSSVCPAANATKGCRESLHKQGRAIDIFEVNGEVSNPENPYLTDPDPDVADPDNPAAGQMTRLSEVQRMVMWLTCEYAKDDPPFGFVLIWSKLWKVDAEDELEDLPEGETPRERFAPCDEPDDRFGFFPDGAHTKHVHLEVRCGPRWVRPAWIPAGPFEGTNWKRDVVVVQCGDDGTQQEVATLLRILRIPSST